MASHIVLPSATLVSGASERGTLVIANNTGQPIHWSCAYLEVQLTNANRPLELHPTPCSSAGRTFPVGTTRLKFTLWASRSVGTTRKPLPPGRYHTQIFPTVPAVIHPGNIAVRIIARAKAATAD